MRITEVTPAQLDEIEAIERACFSLPWRRAALEKQMCADNCLFLSALDDNGTVLGYLGLMHVLGEGYISNIAVTPEHRRRGVADALLEALIARTRDFLTFMTLEVREGNRPAIRLYAKHGFERVGKRKNYYDRPKENALLMTLFFKKV
ncbi:MAG: ribosomal protein S18-alanine N-acetyltransferase [Oscillospiraceae bacterium]|jgi:ribosomal-protein-alanine N-acetyltransferase|nr:ribosomal protein S18-alanine N-acetyltransferase [Oscillospiraceae bacterium]